MICRASKKGEIMKQMFIFWVGMILCLPLTATAKPTLADAKNGDTAAQLYVGARYVSGTDGFKKDGEQAVYWLTEASKKHNYSAERLLVALYRNGKIVKQDLIRAYAWGIISMIDVKAYPPKSGYRTVREYRKKAVRSKIENPSENLVLAWTNQQDMMKRRMTASQIAEAVELSKTLLD